MRDRHPQFYDPTNGGYGDNARAQASQAYAMWACAYELKRIADQMEDGS